MRAFPGRLVGSNGPRVQLANGSSRHDEPVDDSYVAFVDWLRRLLPRLRELDRRTLGQPSAHLRIAPKKPALRGPKSSCGGPGAVATMDALRHRRSGGQRRGECGGADVRPGAMLAGSPQADGTEQHPSESKWRPHDPEGLTPPSRPVRSSNRFPACHGLRNLSRFTSSRYDGEAVSSIPALRITPPLGNFGRRHQRARVSSPSSHRSSPTP